MKLTRELDKDKRTTELNIRYIPTDKKQYLSLLLLADEQESMIDRYLERGELYVMLDEQTQEPLAVAVVTMAKAFAN